MNQISLSPFANFNSAVPWGLWVAIYIWLVGISAGSFMLVCWGNLRNNLSLKKATRLGINLSLAALLVGLLSIQIDLGHIERFYKLFTSPSSSSVMAWMVWLYGVYFLVLVISLRSVKKEISRPFLILSVLFALAVVMVEGLLFAMPPGKQWHSPIFLLHFLTSSLVSAIAAWILIIGISWTKKDKTELIRGLGRIALIFIAVNLLIEIIDMALTGSLGHGESLFLLIGNLIAIALLVKKSPVSITCAGALALINILLAKYHSLISAQLVEPYKGFGNAYIEPRLAFSYAPTLFEKLVAILLICLAASLFYILNKVLPFTREE